MNLNNPLSAISPIDGRYQNQCEVLTNYFSEYALMKYRLQVEVEYFLALCRIPLPQLEPISNNDFEVISKIHKDFSVYNALEIKEIEKTTNHDVKALEYYTKTQLSKIGLHDFSEFVHFGLTSQDINNTAIPLLTKEYVKEHYVKSLNKIIERLDDFSVQWANVPMLSRTHGQPASPTRLGKEFKVFSVRLQEQLNLLRQIPFSAKFGGATGGMNAHFVSFPNINWHTFSDSFIKYLGLERSYPTTQIEHYDNFSALFDTLKRINIICIDLCRDIWHYISIEYFNQKINKDEIGSSAMPHKVNPIDFENAEGNLGIANALFEHLSAKLPISRLQRDLTDSTVLRNIGVPFAHTLIAFNSIDKGFNKLKLNLSALEKDLDNNWAVVSEAIQTILRRENYPEPYEKLKELTRGNNKIDREIISNFIDRLELSQELKQELKQISPFNYIGKLKTHT
ncbi:MAG TPA: adenylosuccinate lyase [Cyclobacteriaceae bacterium]